MVFIPCQLQEKCREQNKRLYATFVDLIKAFDTVSRKGLWQILEWLGCLRKILDMVIQLREDQQGQIRLNGQTQPVIAFPYLQWRETSLCPATVTLQRLLQHDA